MSFPQSRRFCLGMLAAVIGAFALPSHAAGPIVLRVYAQEANGTKHLSAGYDMAAILALPQKSFTTKTPWYKKPVTFTGPLLRDVLASGKVNPGKALKAIALDEYTVTIPSSDAQTFDMIIAHSIDGVALTPRTKGPLFVVYPFDSQSALQSVKYYERSIWQLTSLQVVE